MDKKSTALMIVDMQNAFMNEEGSLAKYGIPTARTRNCIDPILKIKEASKKAGLPVVYIRMALRPDFREFRILDQTFPGLRELGHCVEGTWDYEIVDEVQPDADDIIVNKHTFDAFHETKLEAILRDMGITNIIATGIATNICVESTVRGGFWRNFSFVVPREATASYTPEMEEASFLNFEFGFAKMTTADEIITELTK